MTKWDIVKETIFEDLRTDSARELQLRTLLLGTVFLALISAILTAMNIAKGWWLMTASTGLLVAGFLVAALCAKRKKALASSVITAVMVAVTFSFYALSGQNEGFACLWILLVPVIGPSLLGIRVAFFLSTYFQLFLIALFCTPLNQMVVDHYTATFIARFPVLYFAAFGGMGVLAVQKQYYLNKTVDQAYHDGLTKLYNRIYYTQALEKHAEDDFSLAVFDLNRLKYVNDTFGHLAGDEVICAAADLLSETFGSDSVVARIGGDEFAVISPADSEQMNELLAHIAQEALSWKGSFPGCECPLALSVGCVARGEFPDYSLEEVLKEADRRMYQDKSAWYQGSGFDRRR
ncbi:sensor domain-containing diguanylate cyclase [Adlercreutzia sp. ZJ242]|uniref:sensor domain-containing diguanylate cyclase n=1 Tax=Adlercreutzia sp. ZJ242 TaxID=2709409 RepID=UPI0013EE24D3|nr:sensor domain-containing diguanylate cyclase [Adlercreutzia sp. ZJ242]